MIISLIVAMDEKAGIGKNNTLPWHIRSDLQRFKKLTMNHHIIMGRKTYMTIGKPLHGRKMIIVTRNQSFSAKDSIVVDSIQKALLIAEENHETEVFVIGGGEIFTQTIKLAKRIYLTKVSTDSNADVFFPSLDYADWKEIYSEELPRSEADEFSTVYKVLERKN